MKSNGKYMPYLHCISSPIYIVFQVLKELLIKSCKIRPSDPLFLLILLAFTSADIIFHKNFELHSTLTEKKNKKIRHEFSFFYGYTHPPKPPPPTNLPPSPN